jgi:catechol-2,3-dioxygenase
VCAACHTLKYVSQLPLDHATLCCPRLYSIKRERAAMKYLHTMVRVTDLEQSLYFYRDLLGLRETRRIDNEKGRFTLVFLAPPGRRMRRSN